MATLYAFDQALKCHALSFHGEARVTHSRSPLMHIAGICHSRGNILWKITTTVPTENRPIVH
jgi:hypothetical protein